MSAKDWQTVFFDLDGTLTRSEEGITRCARYAAEKMGYPGWTEERLRVFIGPPLYVSFRDVIGMTDGEAVRACEVYRERYTAIGWKENCVYAGIPRLLRSLHKHGFRAAVTTGKPQRASERICRYFGLTPWLDGIYGTEEDCKIADKTEIIAEAARAVGGKIVVVGDRRFDVEAALANGMDAVGVSYGYGTEEELKEAGAGWIAEDVRGLQSILLGDREPARGVFISMEGMDGCGKTTQRSALVERLEAQGWEVSVTREPGGDGIAEKIRGIILDPANTEMCDETEAYLYAASRAQNVRTRILPALADGRLVVCDRYVDSSIAYQGGGRELGAERIAALNAMATGGLLPDLTVYLEMPAQAAVARRLNAGEPDRLEREKDAFWQRTAKAYDALFAADARVVRVRADQSIEEVSAEMLRMLDERLPGIPVR